MSKSYDSDVSIEELFPDDNIQDHVLTTDMWAGSHDPIDCIEYIVKNDQIIQTTVKYPPSFYKCIDEAIVNALDNMIRMYGSTGDNPVTEINVKFTRDGRFTVRNNGHGVPVGWHSIAKKYSVELIFGTMFKGRAKTDRDSKVTGDANRVGIKIANILSTEFNVDTVCAIAGSKTRKRYTQQWTDHMRKVHPPTITDVKDKQYTEVSFLPDYKVFGMEFTDETHAKLSELIAFRCYTAAAYAGFYTKGKCSLVYQSKPVPVSRMADMATIMFPADVDEDDKPQPPPPMFITTIGKEEEFPWECVIVVKANAATTRRQLAQMSNINGVNVRGGRHIQHITDQIIDGVKDAVVKKLKTSDIKWQPAFVYSNIMIFINAQVPGVRWEGQRKDEAVIDAKKLLAYQLPTAIINKLATELEESILSCIYNTTTVTGLEKRKRTKLDKYVPAKRAGTKDSQECWLLLPEGDSAAGMCSNGITHTDKKTKKPLLGFEYYGYMTLGGVIVNARKEISVKIVGGKKCITVNEKIANNKFFGNFLDATGLDLNAKYDPESATYKKEMLALNYGAIVACVDQDHDGSGFIFPLIVNIFELFWPNLLLAGFVKKWDTPRRRAIPKSGGKIVEFYYDHDFEAWQRADSSHTTTNYTIDYIKGLAGHDDNAVVHMFERFHDNVITYNPDDLTGIAFETMFGKPSAPRKIWLKTPMVIPSALQLATKYETKITDCSTMIHCEGKEHALSNLYQKLWSAIDGMNESGRKILDGSLKVFAQSLQKMKVVTLGGHIITREHYQHGEMSLQESIVGKALLCVGGVQLPQLLPKSNFGTRRLGGGISGGDAGKPRYIFTTLNKKLTDLLYPANDYPNYEFVDEDGERAEPKYFVPIIPMAILESVHIPAHGWKIQTWARDVFAVIKCVRYLINADDIENESPISEIPIDTRGFKGEFRDIRGTKHCFGNYTYNPKTRIVTITELPLRVWSEKYRRNLIKENTAKSPNQDKSVYNVYTAGKKKTLQHEVKMFAREPINHSGKNDVRIEIQLAKPDPKTGIDPYDVIMSYADMHYADGFEEYFELHCHMHDNLCMIETDGSVINFKTYEDVLRHWFPVRKAFYEKRVDRQLALLSLEIRMLENIIRYVSEYREMKLTKLDDDLAEDILKTRSYDRFNKTWLRSRGYIGATDKYIATADLQNNILNSETASYDYLLSTTDREKLAKASESRETKLEKLRVEHAELTEKISEGKFKGAAVWLDELNKLEEVITEGFRTNWEFDDFGKFQY